MVVILLSQQRWSWAPKVSRLTIPPSSKSVTADVSTQHPTNFLGFVGS